MASIIEKIKNKLSKGNISSEEKKIPDTTHATEEKQGTSEQELMETYNRVSSGISTIALEMMKELREERASKTPESDKSPKSEATAEEDLDWMGDWKEIVEGMERDEMLDVTYDRLGNRTTKTPEEIANDQKHADALEKSKDAPEQEDGEYEYIQLFE